LELFGHFPQRKARRDSDCKTPHVILDDTPVELSSVLEFPVGLSVGVVGAMSVVATTSCLHLRNSWDRGSLSSEVSEVLNNAMGRTMRDGVAPGPPNSLEVEASSGEDSPVEYTVGVAAEAKKVGITAEATKRKWLTQLATSHSRLTLDAYTMSGDLGEGFE
jgi:hypothetical protein